jgi:hypothetical protein
VLTVNAARVRVGHPSVALSCLPSSIHPNDALSFSHPCSHRHHASYSLLRDWCYPHSCAYCQRSSSVCCTTTIISHTHTHTHTHSLTHSLTRPHSLAHSIAPHQRPLLSRCQDPGERRETAVVQAGAHCAGPLFLARCKLTVRLFMIATLDSDRSPTLCRFGCLSFAQMPALPSCVELNVSRTIAAIVRNFHSPVLNTTCTR